MEQRGESDVEHEAIRRTVGADAEGIEAMFRNMAQSLAGIRPGESFQDFLDRAPATIKSHVRAIEHLVAECDAFDVLDFLRHRETPMLLDGYRESLEDQRPAVVDLVAVILLARGTRLATRPGSVGSKQPNELVADLHDRASQLLTLGQFSLLDDGRKQRYGPLTMLAGQYVGSELNVKFKQYAHLQDELNEQLFASDHLGDLLLDALGFTYEDFISVRGSIRMVYVDQMQERAESLAEQAEARRGGSAPEPDVVARLRRWLTQPGDRASFTAEDIQRASGVTAARIASVLDFFSVSFEAARPAVDAVVKYLAGETPFRTASLLRDGAGHYLTLNVPIGTDSFRQAVEAALKGDSKRWRRYEKRRLLVSERLAIQRLESLLGAAEAHAGLKYLRPNEGIDLTALGPDATVFAGVAEQTEADALFIVEDVAICLEVKGRSVSTQARGGHVQRLSNDLQATIGEAVEQAVRLENLIRTNAGVWREDRTWLDLSQVREIRSVVVCLDDMGQLSLALDELVRCGIVTSETFPWITSVHDLSVIAEVLDRPAEFLLYLRRRTEPEVSLQFSAVDELDLFMLFLAGGLYIEPDPDRISTEFLGVRKARNVDRRRRRESNVPTRVMTHTDALDAWIYLNEGSSITPAEKPTFVSDVDVLRLVDFLQEERKPGWFRFAADLLALSGEAQVKRACCTGR